MKRALIFISIFFLSISSFANHITGGEIFYTYGGLQSNGKHAYHVTLKLYRDHFSSGATLDPSAAIGFFNTVTGELLLTRRVNLTREIQLVLGSPGPCITNPPVVHYDVGYYEFTIELDASPNGYTLAYQRCCRIAGISNIIGSSSTGATYSAQIPGNSIVSNGPVNNSAQYVGADTVIVCEGYPFTYSFAATDPDGDQLVYSFCAAFPGGGPGQGNGPTGSTPDPPSGPPYSELNYSFPYGPNVPLGGGVNIDRNTGLVSGIAPPQGIYVVTVCVDEIRDGRVIATQRKDLQIKSGDCKVAAADLNPKYVTCDGMTMDFTNLSNSPLINSYYWEFGDPASGANNVSTIQAPTHIFSQPGDYTIKLVTNRGQECSDSTTAVVGVWPGFTPDFRNIGVCMLNAINFEDQSVTAFGVVDSWNWNFGDETSTADVSTLQNPSWNYTTPGIKTVTLTVTNSKGCTKVITKPINIVDKPVITLATKDTLICVPDAVQLQASGTGVFSWTPNTNIINANTATPTVNPSTTTTYYVELNDQGCVNTDSVKVNVVTFVTLNAMPDTTICSTDEVQLRVAGDALRYNWQPVGGVNDPTLQNPIGITGATTTYQVLATIGSCSATRSIDVTAVPYPIANAGPDTTICYNTPAYLHGTHDGSSFTWSPTSSLLNSTTLNPIAYPSQPTEYVLTSLDTRGCPKPGRDTVLVNALPKINAFAGNDTMVIVGQPLQLNAEGGSSYLWMPNTGLSNPAIKNPIGLYGAEIDSIRYKVHVFNDFGCVDSAFVKVTVFKTAPQVFVPTGFTPNGDGLNDAIRPIAVGIKEIKYFSIYNRWGQMIFKTTTNGHGWDGRISGTPQATNVFVWMVSAIDYLDRPFFQKGTVTLIR
jgi:gliding motility-associated-like protein